MNDETSSGRHPTLNNTPDTGSFRDDALRQGKSQNTRKLQLLSVGPLVLGIFEDEIATIAEWRRPTPLPQAPPAVLGVVSIQGRMLTVLDPLSLFGETTTRLDFAAGLLVALRGDEQIGLAVENAGQTVDLAMEDIQPPSDPANSALDGIIPTATTGERDSSQGTIPGSAARSRTPPPSFLIHLSVKSSPQC